MMEAARSAPLGFFFADRRWTVVAALAQTSEDDILSSIITKPVRTSAACSEWLARGRARTN